MQRWMLPLVGLFLCALSVQAATVTVTLQPNKEADLAGYKIEIAPDPAGPWTEKYKGISTVAVIPDLTGKQACARAYAYDLVGNTSLPSATPYPCVALPQKPNKPDFLVPVAKAVLDAGEIEFTWLAQPEATGGYLLRVHVEGEPYSPCELMTFCGSVATNSKKLTIPAGKNVDWWVHGVNAEGMGESAGSVFSTKKIVVVDTEAPAAPVIDKIGVK